MMTVTVLETYSDTTHTHTQKHTRQQLSATLDCLVSVPVLDISEGGTRDCLEVFLDKLLK